MAQIIGPISTEPEALTYFANIVAAGSSISEQNKSAVNTFIKGCKADGIWNAIKACCLLAGPDDLTGALVPLVGTAPSNVNFFAEDYNKTLGLLGDGVSKLLNSNREVNADPIDSFHMATYITSLGTIDGAYYAGGSSTNRVVRTNSSSISFRNRSSSGYSNTLAVGFVGSSRSSTTNFNHRSAGTTTNVSNTATAPATTTTKFFAGEFGNYLNCRLSFYSLGTSLLELALLDARITTYMNSLV